MASSTMIVTLPLQPFDLPQDLCAFSISSSGRRCTLESTTSGRSTEYYGCSSEVVVPNMTDLIENDECVKSCGVDRNTVGISSGVLLEGNFREKLCSDACYKKCPNIVDLYSNLASGEGISLSAMCKSVRSSTDRVMLEVDASARVGGSGPTMALGPNAAHPGPSTTPAAVAPSS